MRILVVGAGAVGGYFGGRLLDAGRDVTFLVRPQRAAELARTGLVIESRLGNVHRDAPTVTADALSAPYDLVFLSCKAYDLDNAITSFTPAVGPETAILPFLNGMRHLDALDARFGASRVLGGLCFISATRGPHGEILHLNENHTLAYGERDGVRSPRVERIVQEFASANFDARATDTIVQEMWEKWVFIAAGAGLTCLMRATVGDIVAAGGADIAVSLLDECAAIAEHAGVPVRAPAMERARATFTAPGSTLAASMLRDVESGGRTEADHVIGALLRLARDPRTCPLLRLAFLHLESYDARRVRERPAN
ncbi:MAG TPA: 2-dehydropantoate 2-reductase [Gemmatimonadaceae bacterium]|nr:2-dehydropantoate 2-reductase [Gemmatimonadaceae bacterium]